MKALLLREIKSFFGSPIGYLVIAIFLVLNGLFLWVFEGDFNIPNSGFADMSPFFKLSPWILIFLIPAVTMRSFSDEKKQGTIELLFTKPLSIWEIVNGKFFGALLLIIIAIIPTLIYVAMISYFSNENKSDGEFRIFIVFSAALILFYLYKFSIRKKFILIKNNVLNMIEYLIIICTILSFIYSLYTIENLDMGSTMGSYFGLLFLICGYTAIGIFTSTLSENQIVAFIIAVFLCFFFYFGFEGIANFMGEFSSLFASFGMDYHFKSMSRGVLDTRDILYFISVTILFLAATVYQLKSLKG